MWDLRHSSAVTGESTCHQPHILPGYTRHSESVLSGTKDHKGLYDPLLASSRYYYACAVSKVKAPET
ncbi:Hypp8769 [Branchiostoma lanceolatum]|uniref:Hypp8769 protein n=1 Tax=Branchiostoma lanceolatum TaxID=7740 RepID=A0A8K0EIJ4_BRALA|nr:Hypp8769 [Branchiostoma lanceolatum]